MAVNKITDETYEELIQNESAVVLLDIWKDGCGPCQALAPEVEKVSEEHSEIKVFSANIADVPGLVEKFRVMAAPTLLVIKDGAVKKKSIGFKSAEHIVEMLDAATKQ